MCPTSVKRNIYERIGIGNRKFAPQKNSSDTVTEG